ncbi:hypothetical protein EBL87_04060 [Cereibacter sphaeroides]|nr:hypothetical protein EBL87_04060 [Cereibacter sphaeroides]
MRLFGDMMQTRTDMTSPVFVASLNLVPVHFSKRQRVIAAYQRVITLTNDPSWHVPDARPVLFDRLQTEVASLLSEMSEAVNLKISPLLILKSGYAPMIWKDEKDAQDRLREAVTLMAKGGTPLPVFVVGGSDNAQIGSSDDNAEHTVSAGSPLGGDAPNPSI